MTRASEKLILSVANYRDKNVKKGKIRVEIFGGQAKSRKRQAEKFYSLLFIMMKIKKIIIIMI